MRLFFYALVLLLGAGCSVEQDHAGKAASLVTPDIEVYKRALAYGTEVDLNKLDMGIEKSLQLRLYRVPLSTNDCFVETHGICQYEYLLSVSSFDELPVVNVFMLPLVGEITRISWRKNDGVDQARLELSLSRYSDAAMKNNPTLKNTISKQVVTVNLKTITVNVLN